MATRQFTVNIDGGNQSLIAWKIYPLTTANRTGLSLGAGDEGLIVYDTDLNKLYGWTGAAWEAIGAAVTGAVVFKGLVNFDASEPGSPATGDMYIFQTAGTNTWNTSDVVQVGDQAIWDGTNWQFFQSNVLSASETVSGVIELATQAEVTAVTDAVRAVTPATLGGYRTAKKIPYVYFSSSETLVAETPKTITHNLNLQNKDAYILSVKDGSGAELSIDNDGVDANSLTITSNIAFAAVNVTVIGF